MTARSFSLIVGVLIAGGTATAQEPEIPNLPGQKVDFDTAALAPLTPLVPDCQFPCTQTGWTTAVLPTLTLPNGCQVVVHYRYRYACGKYEITIDMIEIPNTPQGNPAVCGGYSPAQLMEETIKAVLKANQMQWPPVGSGNCITNFRAIKATCWAWDQESIEIARLVPCSGRACCWTSYQICIGPNNERIVTRTGVMNYGPSTCEPVDPFPACIFLCADN